MFLLTYLLKYQLMQCISSIGCICIVLNVENTITIVIKRRMKTSNSDLTIWIQFFVLSESKALKSLSVEMFREILVGSAVI